MEDTCRGESCWLFTIMRDLGGKTPEIKDCPFYQEMIYTPVGEKIESAKLIRDCANKRGLLWLLEAIHPRVLGMQAANEQARNKIDELCGIFVRGFNQMQSRVTIEQKSVKQIL